MAFGLPVIVRDFCHFKCYILGEDCGRSVAPNDTIAIAVAVIRILKDHKLYQYFSDNGKRVSQEKYKWELEFAKLYRHYNRALNER